MSAAPWKIVVVITLGSAAGALLRQAVIFVVPRSRRTSSGVMLAGSSILGGLLGAGMGAIMTTSALTSEGQSLWLIGISAALGTFGASAVLATSPSPPQGASLLRTAAVHITLVIVAAAFGFGLIHWMRSAGG